MRVTVNEGLNYAFIAMVSVFEPEPGFLGGSESFCCGIYSSVPLLYNFSLVHAWSLDTPDKR